MREKIMAVCDLEEAYAFRMAEFISRKAAIPYTLHLFTETEELENFMEKHDISVLLIGESAVRQLKNRPKIQNVFILWEGEERYDTDYQYIDKYQKPEEIIREVVEHITEPEGWDAARVDGRMEQRLKLKIIGIYSPVRRCLQTSFAVTMGQLLARERIAHSSRLYERNIQFFFVDLCAAICDEFGNPPGTGRRQQFRPCGYGCICRRSQN